ncbi:MAG TPA: HEAT repeat domain-containing protein [Terriglobales bacterium]|jgi:HEAT repeat protein|nr:HEAT repeat domain-containing protein [Terriglobales bacterium]
MEQLNNSLERALENWRQGRASLDQVRKLAGELGERHFEAGIPALVQLLDHDDEIVRYHAAMSLGFDLNYRPATNKLLTMLTKDTDDDIRDCAAGALGTLWQNTKDRHVLMALAKSALNDPDEDVRKSAYKALLIVNGVPREEHLQLLTGESLPVDTARVQSILAAIS